MYSVTSAFKQAIKSGVIQYDLQGVIDNTAFYKRDVLKGSCIINLQCSDNSEVTIGSVYTNELNITLLLPLNRYSLYEKQISLECGVKVGDEYEYVPMGVFTIYEASRTLNGIAIKAYDNMIKLDKDCPDELSGTPYEIANYCCSECGVSLANADFNAFPNTSDSIFLHPGSDIQTFRDALYWLAQSMGCIVTANRDGDIEFRCYGMTVVDTLDSTQRFYGAKFADYETYYTSMSLESMEDDLGVAAMVYPNDGLYYALGPNPFMQSGNMLEKLTSLLTFVNNFKYVPFTTSIAADPSFDLCDVLSLPDGLGDADKKFCITQMSWKYGESLKISGSGKNPKLKSVKSKTEKQLDSISKQKNDKDVIQYYSFTNTSDITIHDTEIKTIVDIHYTATKKTMAIFLAEVLAEIETKVDGITYYDAEAEFLYYVDEILLDRIPKETWRDGDHIKHLEYYISTEAGILHHLEIKCKMTTGQAFIKMGAIKACLYGQNLVASDDWNGIINLREHVSPFALSEMEVAAVTDTETLSTHAPITETATETVSGISLVELGVAGAVDIVLTTLDRTSKGIITETGDSIVTETDEDAIYTEGD